MSSCSIGPVISNSLRPADSDPDANSNSDTDTDTDTYPYSNSNANCGRAVYLEMV